MIFFGFEGHVCGVVCTLEVHVAMFEGMESYIWGM